MSVMRPSAVATLMCGCALVPVLSIGVTSVIAIDVAEDRQVCAPITTVGTRSISDNAVFRFRAIAHYDASVNTIGSTAVPTLGAEEPIEWTTLVEFSEAGPEQRRCVWDCVY
jgi:hypothetical protein